MSTFCYHWQLAVHFVIVAASNICDTLRMDTKEICAYRKLCPFVSDDLILLLPEHERY